MKPGQTSRNPLPAPNALSLFRDKTCERKVTGAVDLKYTTLPAVEAEKSGFDFARTGSAIYFHNPDDVLKKLIGRNCTMTQSAMKTLMTALYELRIMHTRISESKTLLDHMISNKWATDLEWNGSCTTELDTMLEEVLSKMKEFVTFKDEVAATVRRMRQSGVGMTCETGWLRREVPLDSIVGLRWLEDVIASLKLARSDGWTTTQNLVEAAYNNREFTSAISARFGNGTSTQVATNFKKFLDGTTPEKLNTVKVKKMLLSAPTASIKRRRVF